MTRIAGKLLETDFRVIFVILQAGSNGQSSLVDCFSLLVVQVARRRAHSYHYVDSIGEMDTRTRGK